jgi:hypothetical protein
MLKTLFSIIFLPIKLILNIITLPLILLKYIISILISLGLVYFIYNHYDLTKYITVDKNNITNHNFFGDEINGFTSFISEKKDEIVNFITSKIN